MIDSILLVWFGLTAVSVIYVAWDAFTRNPEMKIMRFGWVLVTLYLGPVAAVFYILSCREPAPGTHKTFVKPMWKQALGSTIHCVAGDATGIIAAAVVTAALGTPMWADLITEYIFGFAFGLLVFQSLFLKDEMGGSYIGAVRKTFFPEFISMNMVMAAMVPTMVLLMMGRDMRAKEPTQPLFWGVMSLAVGFGLIFAYPANWWLVQAKLKHGMGTVRALGKGGHSLAAERQYAERLTPPTGAPTATMADVTDHRNGGGDRTDAMKPTVTCWEVGAMTVLSILALTAGVWIAADNVNLSLSAKSGGGSIMPRGMIMRPDQSGASMKDVSAVDVGAVRHGTVNRAAIGSSSRVSNSDARGPLMHLAERPG